MDNKDTPVPGEPEKEDVMDILKMEGVTVLDMNSDTFFEDFAKAVGAKETTAFEVNAPQHERDDGTTPEAAPATLDDWKVLPKQSRNTLLRMGCRRWDELPNNSTLWLFPFEWYDSILEGMPIYTIDNKVEFFKKGETSDIKRFGCLAYGFIAPTNNIKGQLNAVVLDPESPTFKEYEMSPEDLSMLLDAMKPVPMIMLQIPHHPGNSIQERMNTAWKALGERMGFDYMTARPDPRHDHPRFFTAIPLPDHKPSEPDTYLPELPEQKVVEPHEEYPRVNRSLIRK